ncbi:MAG: hypothetical protein IT518_10775 [Burkholderiales bacterium]|nr:hypothetical protein [Burkholderiales bacterium]
MTRTPARHERMDPHAPQTARLAAPGGGAVSPSRPVGADPRQRAANRRTALILASIAVVFFLGIVLAKFTGDAGTSMTVLGFAVLLFLALAIGRNLRGQRRPRSSPEGRVAERPRAADSKPVDARR